MGYGVISDITTQADRGSYVSTMLLGYDRLLHQMQRAFELITTLLCSPNIAPPLGPVIGGALASSLGWKWIFWFLSILGGVCLALILITFPETARHRVGNGGIPARGIDRTLWSIFKDWRDIRPQSEAHEQPRRPKMSLPNPLASLKLLIVPNVSIVLLTNGIYYMIYCCVQASLSSLFMDLYGYDELEAGLIYLPFGAACLASLLTWGKFFF